jgi:hypothetical protein
MLEELKDKLHEYIVDLGGADFSNLTDSRIVAKSQELDLEIIKAMRGGEKVGC